MTPSERTNVIKEIAAILNKEDWSLIDLTLKQFKFPISDSYNGTSLNYIIDHIQDEPDDKLLDLALHLNLSVNSVESEINPSFWKDGFIKLFISHLASDKKNAKELKVKLEKYAISGFVAHSDIEPTREWQNEIEVALRTCDALTALMVPGFHDSKWTDQEIGIALGRDLLIIPVRMGQDPYGFIGKFQAILFKDIGSLAEDILITLLKNKKTSKRISYALMYKFENSDSFIEARRNIELVDKIEYWDNKLIERLRNSVNNNSQISQSFGVPNKINYILQRLNIK